MTVNIRSLKTRFKNANVNSSWSFEKERSQGKWTHGYHRYPAKFLPNIVSKLIEHYTDEGDLVADVFAGCGTTLIEAKIHGRKSVGIDINPVSQLITSAKINPIKPELLQKHLDALIEKIESYSISKVRGSTHERIDHWFGLREKRRTQYLLTIINQIRDIKVRNFFLCAFSHILKNTSFWLQKSIKPQIDPEKEPADPFEIFIKHSRFMVKKNNDYRAALKEKGHFALPAKIKLSDARKTGIRASTVSTVITSPPYVTSYEYADIHQLTGYWLKYFDTLSKFRKRFIGTFYSSNKSLDTKSVIGKQIVDELSKKDMKTALEIANYFNDMYKACLEIKRILKKGGKVCLVIGNTEIKDTKIYTAEVFGEIFLTIGLRNLKLIKRAIPVKLIPTVRNKKTGKFTSLSNKTKKLIYPEEFILIAEK